MNRSVDRISDEITEQMTEYCAAPYHRRMALYVLVNGELEQQQITITVECPGDDEIES